MDSTTGPGLPTMDPTIERRRADDGSDDGRQAFRLGPIAKTLDRHAGLLASVSFVLKPAVARLLPHILTLEA